MVDIKDDYIQKMSYLRDNKMIDLESRRRNKKQLLEDLFNEHSAALRAFLSGRTGNQAEAEDLLQEAFVRLARIENLVERSDKKIGNIKSFLFTTANNLATDSERRRAVRRKYQENEGKQLNKMVFEITPEVSLTAHYELKIIKNAILELPPTWAKAFTLSRFKYMSYKEVAEEMQVSAKTVEKYINKSLVRLRNVIEESDKLRSDL